MDIDSNYGLLRVALTRHFAEAGTLEPCSIASEKALVRAAAKAGQGIHLPSQESAEAYLRRYARDNGIVPKPVEYDRERYWRDWDRDRHSALPSNYN